MAASGCTQLLCHRFFATPLGSLCTSSPTWGIPSPEVTVSICRVDFGLVKAGFSNSLWYISTNRLSADGKDVVMKLEFLPGTFSKVHFVDTLANAKPLSFRKVNVKTNTIKDDRGRNYDTDRDGSTYMNIDSTLTFKLDSFEVANIKSFKGKGLAPQALATALGPEPIC